MPVASFTPMPLSIGASTNGVPHVPPAPDSIKHASLQPSPDSLLPSSHCSPPTTMPSPQPAVSLWQEPLQPSPVTRLPSSHCSEPSLMPSPHAGGDGSSLPALLHAASAATNPTKTRRIFNMK